MDTSEVENLVLWEMADAAIAHHGQSRNLLTHFLWTRYYRWWYLQHPLQEMYL